MSPAPPQPQTIQALPQNTPVLDALGNFARVWFLFLNSIVQALNYLLSLNIAQQLINITALVNGKESAILYRLQSELAATVTALNGKPPGQLVYVTDYNHLLIWIGSAFQWAPGECESDWFQMRASPPASLGWQICDGTTGVNFLMSDGTLGTRDLPDVTSGAYARCSNTYDLTITSAAVPTVAAPTITVDPTTLSQAGFTAGASQADVQAIHIHNAHSTDPVATLTGDPIPHFTVELYYRR